MSTYLGLWQQQAQQSLVESNRMKDLASDMYVQHTLQHCYQVWCQRLKALVYCRYEGMRDGDFDFAVAGFVV